MVPEEGSDPEGLVGARRVPVHAARSRTEGKGVLTSSSHYVSWSCVPSSFLFLVAVIEGSERDEVAQHRVPLERQTRERDSQVVIQDMEHREATEAEAVCIYVWRYICLFCRRYTKSNR